MGESYKADELKLRSKQFAIAIVKAILRTTQNRRSAHSGKAASAVRYFRSRELSSRL